MRVGAAGGRELKWDVVEGWGDRGGEEEVNGNPLHAYCHIMRIKVEQF
jgi:hypothetical protein